MRIFNRKQKQRLSIDELKSQLNVKKKTSSKLQLPKSPASALLKLSDEEKKQVVAWLDLERNAEILQKTDKAIAAKLNVKTEDSQHILEVTFNYRNYFQKHLRFR